jgi:general secretion pathway protein I
MWILESYKMECWRDGVLEGWNNTKQEQYSNTPLLHYSKRNSGFTFLEVMVAIAIIAITLVAVFGSQSQSLSLANEAKFSTTAALLAQSKMAEIEAVNPEDLASDSGDFGENFPNYHWNLTVQDISFVGADEVLSYLKQIDLSLFYGEQSQYQYGLRLYRFVRKSK